MIRILSVILGYFMLVLIYTMIFYKYLHSFICKTIKDDGKIEANVQSNTQQTFPNIENQNTENIGHTDRLSTEQTDKEYEKSTVLKSDLSIPQFLFKKTSTYFKTATKKDIHIKKF